MRLDFQERSELKIQSRIDPLELSRGSPGLIGFADRVRIKL